MYQFKNPEDKIGTISNLDVFLHRSLDTGFKTKWSGLWKPPYKLMDYYSYKVNGIWLDQENLEGVEYGDEMTFYFETDSLRIEENVSMPEDLAGMESKLRISNKHDEVKAVRVGLEAGIDIRDKSTDIASQDYRVERNSERVKVSKENNVEITCSEKIENGNEPYIKEHHPGEKQKCIIPGDISARIKLKPEETKSLEFRFTSGEASEHIVENKEQRVENIQSRVFNASVKSMENLIYDRQGLGILAGHPWFQSYWARDSFWTILGLIDSGYFEESKKILENFAEKDLPGKINLNGENEEEGRIDTYPLYIIAADKLKRHYGISDKIEAGMKKAFNHLKLEGNIVDHDPEGTWMDTLDRDSAVDVQSLWLKAAEIMDRKEADKLKEGLKSFEEEGTVKDSLSEYTPHTINPAVGLIFGHFKGKHLSEINAEFSSRYGARTRSFTDPGYDSSGYHTGSSWGLTTCWAAMANFKHGNTVEGLNFLEKLGDFLDKDQPGALPEVVDSENGENLGCVEQAWSAGLFVHAMDSYLFGIEVDEDKVEIDPVEGFTGKRKNKRIGDKFIDIEFDNGKAKVLNKPDLDREVIT